MPSVTYPRATWRLQAEQEAVPVCEEEKTELFVFRIAFMTCYFEKLVIAVNRNLCGYCINNVGRTQSLHMFTKNTTSFLVIAVKASNFVGRFADKFSRGLCLDFVRSVMAS